MSTFRSCAVATTVMVIVASSWDLPLGAGQAEPPRQVSRASSSTAGPSQQHELTVTGCLMRTDTSARRPGTTGSYSPGAAPPEAKKPVSGFALKNVIIGAASEAVHVGAPESNTGQVGATGTSGMADKPRVNPIALRRSEVEFRLTPSSNVDLTSRINQLVEVRGRFGSGTEPAQRQLTPGRADTANALTVTEIRVLAPTCGVP
jgi:hypothetical protein